MTEATNSPAGNTPAARRVVVVDDHALFRSGVHHDIGGRVQIVGEGSDVPTAVAAILRTQPDVVLLDVHLPGGGGVEVLKQVHATEPEIKFLALSVSDAADDVIGVIRAGARGYAYKEIARELFISIKTVETHVSSVLRKLQLSNRHQLTRWATDRRLV